MTSTVHGGNLEVWTFPQRIRIAADTLREVAAYRSQTIHGESGTGVSEHSTWTPYNAGQLDEIADTIERQEAERDKTIELFAKQLEDAATGTTWNDAIRRSLRGIARQMVDAGWHR